MKKNRYVYLLGLISLFLINLLLFPKFDLYINYPVISTFLISILGTVLISKFISPTKSDRKGALVEVIMPIIMFFSFIFFNLNLSVDHETKELNRTGIKTTAIITDKDHLSVRMRLSTRKSHTYNFSIVFKNNKNESVNATIDVLKDEYEKYQIGEKIQIIYSSENNKLIHVYHEIETVISEKENSSIGVAELIKLIPLSNDSISTKLNSMNNEWRYNLNDSTWIINNIKIKLCSKTKIILTSFEPLEFSNQTSDLFSSSKYADQFRMLKFKEEKDQSSIRFSNAEYKGQISLAEKQAEAGVEIGLLVEIEKK